MQRRPTILLALASTSCLIGEPIGDLPGQGDTGAGSLDPSSEASGEVGDGHSSDPDDDGTSETTFDPTSADESTTGDGIELCTHSPSGLEPGSVVWQEVLSVYPRDVVALDAGVLVLGEEHLLRWTTEGEPVFDVELAAPGSSLQSLQLVALRQDQFVAAFYDWNDGEPEYLADRWLMGFDGDGENLWETSLGEGSFAIAATGTGTVAVVSASSSDGIEWATTLLELDDHGDVIRSVPTDIVVDAPVQGGAAGPSGELLGFGLAESGSWIAQWREDYDANWSDTRLDVPTYAVAFAPGGDAVVAMGQGATGYLLERLDPDQAAPLWERELAEYPHDVDVDCDGSIVIGGHDGVSRRDADGTLQWTTPLGDSPLVVDIDSQGNIYSIVHENVEDPILVKLAGL